MTPVALLECHSIPNSNTCMPSSTQVEAGKRQEEEICDHDSIEKLPLPGCNRRKRVRTQGAAGELCADRTQSSFTPESTTPQRSTPPSFQKPIRHISFSSSLPRLIIPSGQISSHAKKQPLRHRRSDPQPVLRRRASSLPPCFRSRDLSSPVVPTASPASPSTTYNKNGKRPRSDRKSANQSHDHLQCPRSVILLTPLAPPITSQTLKELDLNIILRQPQLRHDLVLDSQMLFRADNDGLRGERKRGESDRYWTAVHNEIVLGCLCTAFTYTQGDQIIPLRCICSTLDPRYPIPSRIPTLIHELRTIILTLLPLPHLIQTLDPMLVATQIRDGSFDSLILAELVATTMKLHCAPMRDDAVDRAIECFRSGGAEGVVMGLRKTFEMLELMKLDIVNHQMRSSRPMLINTAIILERESWQMITTSTSNHPAVTRSRDWIIRSVKELSLGESAVTKVLVDRAVRAGLLSLVFKTFLPTLAQSPAQLPAQPLADLPSFPETLKFDSSRIIALCRDVNDLLTVYLLLLIYQQIVFQQPIPRRVDAAELIEIKREILIILRSRPSRSLSSSARPRHHTIDNVLLHLAARATKSTMSSSATSISGPSLPLPDASILSLLTAMYNIHNLPSSTLLQKLRQRLQEALECAMDCERARVSELARCARRPIGVSNKMTRSGGCTAQRGVWKLKEEDMASDPMKADLQDENDGTVMSSNDAVVRLENNLTKNGMKSLVAEIRSVGDRLARLESFHVEVHGDWYACVVNSSRV